MNKSQKLDVMQLRAKIKADEAEKQHEQAWHGQEPEVIKNIEKVEQEE
jgi:hypothetical protein